MQNSPEFSTDACHKYNDKLDVYSYDKLTFEMEEATEYLRRLRSINRATLSTNRKVSYDVMKNMLETFITGYRWKDHGPLNPFNFLEGWQVNLSRIHLMMPFDTQGDFINYVRRLELVPNQLDQMVELTEKAIELGNCSHLCSVSRIPEQIEAIVETTDPTQSELYRPYNKFANILFNNESDKSYVSIRLKRAILNVYEKFKEIKVFIEEKYIPATRPGLGLSTEPNGRVHYRDALRWHLSLNISPEEVHKMGISEVERITRQIRKLMTGLGFPTMWKIPFVLQKMTNDKKFLIEGETAILERYRSIISQRIEPQIPKYFRNIPELPLEVMETPGDGVGAEYIPGTADGSRCGIFYVNTHRPEDNPTFMMVSLSLHEGTPGHHLAASCSLHSGMPDFRKYMDWKSYNVPYFFPFYNAYVEGWALYCEYLGEEMGVYDDDYELLGRYSDEVFRACRMVVDTGIHYYNWTREEAIEYLLNFTVLTPEAAAIEVDRYATWPGQACGYKIGEMKIKEMRAKAEKLLGDDFNIKDFHYHVLMNGPLPFDVLEQIIDEWIMSVQNQGRIVRHRAVQTKESGINAPRFKFLDVDWKDVVVSSVLHLLRGFSLL